MYNPIVAAAAAIKEVKKETVTITEIHIEISAFLSTLHTIFLSNVLSLCIYSSFGNYIPKALGCCCLSYFMQYNFGQFGQNLLKLRRQFMN